jgi:acylphosphatase
VTVRGRVQGVGFRLFVARHAGTHAVAGWVRNRPDGTLEAVFEGRPDDVEALVSYACEGPRGAYVERAEVIDEEPEGLLRFAIR